MLFCVRRVSHLADRTFPFAYAGMYAALLAYLNPGDEVICIEPFFDQVRRVHVLPSLTWSSLSPLRLQYTAQIVFNGGVPVYVPLHPPPAGQTGAKPSGKDWVVDFDELR